MSPAELLLTEKRAIDDQVNAWVDDPDRCRCRGHRRHYLRLIARSMDLHIAYWQGGLHVTPAGGRRDGSGS